MVTLNIPRLLRAIDLNRLDPYIVMRCKEAHHVLRQSEKQIDPVKAQQLLQHALTLARTAVEIASARTQPDKRTIAAENYRRSTIGVALWYLAYLRHLSDLPGERPRALLTGQMAVSWLRHDGHHHALALLSLARMAQEDEQLRLALLHYQAALVLLEKMIAQQHRKGDAKLETEYQDIRQAVLKAIRRLDLRAALLAEAPLPEAPPERSWLERLPIPSALIWAGPDLAGIQLTPIHSPDPHVAILSRPVKLTSSLDYIETDTVSLDNQVYRIDAAQSGKFRLQVGQLYYVFQFAAPDQRHILVRPLEQHIPRDYPIVFVSPAREQAWLVESQPANPAATVIGERQWRIQDGTETIIYNESDVQIVGTVVALLTPGEPSKT